MIDKILKPTRSLTISIVLILLWLIEMPSYAQYDSVTALPDTIHIASEPDYPPYCTVDENGNADGFSVELFKAAADAVGFNVHVKVGVWNHIKSDLAEGRIDALPLVGRTPEREELFDFTMPYLSLHGAVFVRKGNTGIQSLEDLRGKEIAVMKGDNAEEFVRRENLSDKIVTTKTFEEAFRKLASKQHDAVITQRVMGIKLLEDLGIRSVKPLDIQLPEYRQDFCFAVQEGDKKLLERLNEGLSIVIANGTFDEIKQKWFGPDEGEGYTTADILKITFSILIPLIAIGVLLWIYFLRSELKRRTKKLNEEITEHEKTLDSLKKERSLLQQSEQQIRLLLNSTAEGIYAIDNNGDCTMINKSALEMLGYTNREQVIGKNMHYLIHHTKADGSAFDIEDCEIYKAFKEGKGEHSENDILWRADGTSFPAEYFSFPIRKEDEVKGAVITFWDITERKKAENELVTLKNNLQKQVTERTAELEEKVRKLDRSQKAMLYMVEDLNRITSELKEERRKLKLSNQELEAFTYSVSHDLRAPLRAINGYSKFLVEDYADSLGEEGKRFIDTIRANASKMDKLITDLLNLSRISRADMKLYDVDMQSTVKEVFRETATNEEQQQFELLVDDIPAAQCDPSLIRIVWQNLISNALKYSAHSETKKLEISGAFNDQKITYCVRDYGAGFDNQYVDKIFGVFQRLHKENEYAGTGIGLATVQRIIHRHGGEVWAKGEKGKGAEFCFSLPVK
ncbi:MAG: transporter substrate-binding domain-containing protein [Bacteroidota bacterium]